MLRSFDNLRPFEGSSAGDCSLQRSSRTDLDTLEPLQGIHWKSSRLHLGGRVFSLRVCSGCYSPMPFEERDSISTITKTFSLGFSSFVELQG